MIEAKHDIIIVSNAFLSVLILIHQLSLGASCLLVCVCASVYMCVCVCVCVCVCTHVFISSCLHGLSVIES